MYFEEFDCFLVIVGYCWLFFVIVVFYDVLLFFFGFIFLLNKFLEVFYEKKVLIFIYVLVNI